MKLNARFRKIILPAVIALPILIVLAVIFLRTEREPLSARDIMAKKDWTEDELRLALGRSMHLRSDRDQRREVETHLRTAMKNFSPEEQKRIRVGAISDAMDHGFTQLRLLAPAERQKVLNRMREQTERTREQLKKTGGAERERIHREASSEETKEVLTELNRKLANRVTPELRAEMQPLVESWMNMVREL